MSGQFDLANRIKINNPYSNVDIYYGPWLTLEEACLNIPIEIRGKGLTIGITDGQGIKEYWWKNGIQDVELIPKTGTYISIGYGEKKTGIDSGEEFELSVTDDYLYICVQSGDEKNAIWKKIVLFQT